MSRFLSWIYLVGAVAWAVVALGVALGAVPWKLTVVVACATSAWAFLVVGLNERRNIE